MIASIAQAIGQLPDPRFRRVLLRGLVSTTVLYLILYALIAWGLRQLHLFDAAWLNAMLDVLGGGAVVALSILLFPAVATLVLSFLLDDIAAAVEERHYPALPPADGQGWGEAAWSAVRFTGITVLVNLLALPIYIPLLFFGVGALLFYVVNGYLLGREYFELVACRRLPLAKADTLRRAHLGRLWLMGAALAFLSSVPFVNLLAPMIGTAAMLHEFEALRQRHPDL